MKWLLGIKLKTFRSKVAGEFKRSLFRELFRLDGWCCVLILRVHNIHKGGAFYSKMFCFCEKAFQFNRKNYKFQSLLTILAGILANSNDMPLSQPNPYQSNWDLSAKYQQDEIIFQDMIKDGGNKNKYNVDSYELRQSDADSFAGDNYGPGKYYEKDLTYLLENVNSRELQPSVRSVTGKFSIGNVISRFWCHDNLN